MTTRRELPMAFGANTFAINVGWARFLCPHGQPLPILLRDLQLSRNCQRVRSATCGSWARYALPTLRSLNLKSAKALGLTIPPPVMVQATRVIE
jgi:hypothetical protein